MSPDIIAETFATLIENDRARQRYRYTPRMASEFLDELLAVTAIVVNPPPTPGAVPRDADDDKIIACAVAASAQYLITRDDDLLSLGAYQGISIITPADFVHIVRQQFGRLSDQQS